MSIEETLKKLTSAKGIANPNASTRAADTAIAKWEKMAKLTLPDDYKTYLRDIGECILHPGKHSTYAVKIYALADVRRFEYTIDSIEGVKIPKEWFTIADLQDGNFVIMDLSMVKGNSVQILDGFSEDVGYELEIIARSFSEFLEHAIEDRNISSGWRRRYGLLVQWQAAIRGSNDGRR